MTDFPLDFEYALGKPAARAFFRAQPEDFRVEESLGFVPCGEGEHVYLQVRKRNQNTLWVARQLARFCRVRNLDVGYCGLKDRHAITTQWFSIYLPKGPAPAWSAFVVEDVELINVSRHTSKLKPGVHRSNHFSIRLRDCTGEFPDAEAIARGVPNYFGEQRFGIDAGNLPQAHKLLVERQAIRNKKQRGLMISAARSYLFNRVLSERIARGDWQVLLPGDQNDGPTGPLWGRGRSPVSGATAAVEEEVLAHWQPWCEGLEHVGLAQERRALVCRPREFSSTREGPDRLLSFSLAPGQYATAVLREIAQLEARALML